MHDVHYTAVFTVATDEENEPSTRGEVVERITALAEDMGCLVDIHPSNMLEPSVEEVFGEPMYSVRVKGDTAEADSYSGAALALHTLAKENDD